VVVEEEEAVAVEAEAEDHPVEERQQPSHKSRSLQHET
jgi:hypothetical protein